MEGGELRTYQLLIGLTAPQRIRIGRLGEFDFPAGRYVYTGSARRCLKARIARHLSASKKLHWHIDFLLAAQAAQVLEVQRFQEDECWVNRRTPGRILIPGFGAGDCRARCVSHLKYCGDDNRASGDLHRSRPN